MKARAKYSFKGFETRTENTVLIGGSENFCRERFGYRQTENGIEPSYFPVAVEPAARVANIWFAEYCPALGFTIFVTRPGQVARWNLSDYTRPTVTTIVNPNPPFVVACADGGEPTYALIGGTKIAIFKGTAVNTYTLPYRVLGGTYHCGRIFAVDKEDPYVVRWSGFALRDWTLTIDSGGHMRVNPKGGKVLGIVELNEKLVLIREHALTVFNALADARHFRLVQYGSTYLTAVTDQSWVVVGGKLWLCTEEGLNVFDGESLTRVQIDTCGKKYAFGRAVAFADRYIYLACTEGEKLCFLEYDTLTGATANFAKGCYMLFCTDDSIYCYEGTSVSRLTEGLEDKNRVWTSRAIDLGTGAVKTLKNLVIEGEGQSEITIECGGRTRTIDRFGKIYVGEVGVSFTFSVRGTGTVTRLAAEWEVRK